MVFYFVPVHYHFSHSFLKIHSYRLNLSLNLTPRSINTFRVWRSHPARCDVTVQDKVGSNNNVNLPEYGGGKPRQPSVASLLPTKTLPNADEVYHHHILRTPRYKYH